MPFRRISELLFVSLAQVVRDLANFFKPKGCEFKSQV